MDEGLRERLRIAIEDAVTRALEAGMSADDVSAEVAYAIQKMYEQP